MSRIVRVLSTVGNYYRGGVLHRKGAADYPADLFSTKQLEAILSDPRLSAKIIDVSEPGSVVLEDAAADASANAGMLASAAEPDDGGSEAAASGAVDGTSTKRGKRSSPRLRSTRH